MDEWKRFIAALGLIALVGIALNRLLGAVAYPFVVLAIYTVGRASWRDWQRRRGTIRRALIELREYAADDRNRLVDAIESDHIRLAVASALAKENTERSDGVTEIFPMPDIFRRRAVWRYWRSLGCGAVSLAFAAFMPDLPTAGRLSLVALGLFFIWQIRKFQRWRRFAESVIEINPYRISLVLPDRPPQTISFSVRPRCEDDPAHRCFAVRSGDVVIPVSYHLIGFNRLAQLVEQYGAVMPTPSAPAS